jgi:hypothetical protein
VLAVYKEQERIRRKLERQQAMPQGRDNGKRTYTESFQREKEKQKALQKGSKQRRDDLCEALGRGC